MANINVTFTENTITVDENTSNVTVATNVSNIVVTGSSIASNADIRAALSATSPVTYNSITGVIGVDANALFTGKTTDDLPEGSTNLYFEDSRAVVAVYNGNVQLRRYIETIVDNGNVSGSVTFNMAQGTIHKARLVGNVTNISLSNVYAGGSATLILKQDEVGGHSLDTTAMTTWKFVNENDSLDQAANADNILSVVYDGSNYFASMIDFSAGVAGTITINGVTIPINGSGNITTSDIAEGTNLYYSNARVNAFIQDNITTTDIDEGTRLYYTDARVNTFIQDNITTTDIDEGSNLYWTTDRGNINSNAWLTTKSTSDLAEGTNLYYTTDRANSAVAAYTAANPITVGGNLNVNGNITATGNINYQNVTDLYVTDQKITLNSNAATNANVEVIAYRPEATDTKLKWNEQIDRWEFTNDGTTYYPIPTSTSDLAEGTNLYFTTARANTAIDNRLIGGTGISYNTGTIALDFTEFSTSNITEGTNLYYTTARANTAIDGRLIGGTGISYASGNISIDFSEFSTSNITEGTNLYYTTARANSAIGAYQGSISTPGNISAAYVSGNGSGITNAGSIAVNAGTGGTFRYLLMTNNTNGGLTPETRGNLQYYAPTDTLLMPNGSIQTPTVFTDDLRGIGNNNITINTNDHLILTQKFKNVETYSGNITSDGYAFFGANAYGGDLVTGYTGNANIENFIFATGNTTSGSNAITGVSLLQYSDSSTPSNIADVAVNSVFTINENGTYPFPLGTRVTSVDAANSIIYMNQPASANVDLTLDTLAFFLHPALIDTQTNQAVQLLSEFDATGSGSKTTLIGSSPIFTSIYGYPQSGFDISNFNVFTAGSANDYTLGDVSAFMVGRNKIEAPKTVLQAPNGLIVGKNADLTNRAENDILPSFGVNILWDGTDDSYLTNPLTQILLKNYTDNNLQANDRTRFGPRLFFTASEGNATDPYTETYPRKNLELGRISWWAASKNNPGLGTANPPAWISGVTGQDHLERNSGVGLYFGTSPNVNNNNRSIWLAATKGQTYLAGGYQGNNTANITFGPLYQAVSNGNSALMYDNAITQKLFANVGYADMSDQTGSRLTITNGPEQLAPGDLVFEFDRKVSPSIATIDVDPGYGIYDAVIAGGTSDHAVVSIYLGGVYNIAPTTTAITFSGVTGPGAANINGQTFYINNSEDPLGYGDAYYLFNDSGLTSPVLMSTLGAVTGSTGNGIFTYAVAGVSSNARWTMELEEANTSLKFKSNTSTTVSIEQNGNVNITGNINLTGRLLGYDKVYGEFCYTGGNIVPAAADTVYAFPFDTTNMASDVIANNTSRINITKPGTFKLIMSLQVKNADNSTDHIMRFWLRKNGVDVANSATLITPLKLQEQVVAMDWMVESDGDDYFEIVYYVNDTDVTFPYYAGGTTPVTYPAAPPIIVNVIPVGA